MRGVQAANERDRTNNSCFRQRRGGGSGSALPRPTFPLRLSYLRHIRQRSKRDERSIIKMPFISPGPIHGFHFNTLPKPPFVPSELITTPQPHQIPRYPQTPQPCLSPHISPSTQACRYLPLGSAHGRQCPVKLSALSKPHSNPDTATLTALPFNVFYKRAVLTSEPST